ncbi:FliA/WhiG family RNA polymerase sigma factor [Lederbergia wuyishanensis]|uniref:RNA polymerase sigma factor for flagellar operon FliA n=1 Tax=Lederbergia wuyishanensis TaxID=1347903 RepID=A0ABU0CZU0_9BACI|nr:FliA/WhiG family RNA polymerase sigma factor [Lederbergia wuyishanensis]MCJ8006289.1 FliA/WhiG family RNA polymerase sigma factor [Lederbergia wuyishanensis]MDQ0341658.1 RNA polymerase sigma factor for flagellar operon FliA [Lederbergia wuyishanensis]
MSNSPPLEEKKYWELWTHSRDADAGDILVEKYLPLVSYHVQRISVGLPRNVSREELKSLGLMGLLDALNKYDISRDLKFDTYASFRIRGAIIDGLRKEDWLPRSTRDKVKKIETITNMLEQKLLRHASIEEIASESGFSEDEVCKTLNEHFYASVLSMDEQIYDQDDDSHSHNIHDEETLTPEEQIVKKEWLNDLEVALAELNEKEQLVLSLFYKEELTFTEIGEILQLSTSRISQIHSKAIVKLKNVLLK